MPKLLRNQDFCSEKIAQKLLMKLHLEQKTKNLNFTQAENSSYLFASRKPPKNFALYLLGVGFENQLQI